ncbi:MAG: ABC transporter permease, partial [Clostridia bacterium]
QDKKIINEMNSLFNRYQNCFSILATSYDSSMCVDALNSITNKSQRAKLLGYANVSLYEQEETAIRYKYYIENHSSPSDYANSLSVTHTSNGKINAYDFTFFVMSLFSVGVILFAIYLSAHTISGEISNNTMRFVSIRPVKRSSLFFGKYFAILIMSALLLLFGTITSLIVGGILFGFESANILMIINGNLIFTIHPILAILIFILSSFMTIAVYSSISILLSTILKSELLAMLIGVIIYTVSLILPLFFGINSWLKFYPLANINLFSYFGTTRITSDSVLAKLFNNVVYHGMNIWISLIYIIGISIILLLIARHIFKKREL